MYTTLNISKTGMWANQNRLDLISNNIANVETIGYKKLYSSFSELITESLYENSKPTNSKDALTEVGTISNQGIMINEQGAIKETGINTNLAINGDGYFRIINKDGQYLYTRNGDFNIDGSKKIVDKNGNILEIEFNGGYNYENSNFDIDTLNINNDGTVYSNNVNIGRIKLYDTTGDNAISYKGDGNYYLIDGAVVNEIGNPKIYSKSLELSNVDISKEMTEMLKVQRAYQLNTKTMQASDHIWGIANNISSR